MENDMGSIFEGGRTRLDSPARYKRIEAEALQASSRPALPPTEYFNGQT
jgi:hypothetical protein